MYDCVASMCQALEVSSVIGDVVGKIVSVW